jgi:hypothetical protein
MTIKRKDGTPFTLSKPNPIMTKQEVWDDLMIATNFKYEEISYRPTRNRLKQGVVFVDVTEETTEYKEPIVELSKRNEFAPSNRNKMVCYVLPVETKTIIDPLYGETQKKKVYGKQFTMEIEFIKTNDLMCEIWTNSIPSIEKNSIIFIVEDRQWWRVQSTNPDKNGIHIACMVSTENPSFST